MKYFGFVLAFVSFCSAAEPQTVRIDRHQPVRMRDGVTLYADVYRPAADKWKGPVLVIRTPYGVQRDGVHETLIRFAQNGYAAAVQDVRGRYESEGNWDPFRNEANDGYDTVQWAAAQPWSNGKVGLEGGSYLGHVQWRAASQAPPALVAMFPAVASTNIYKNWLSQGGAFRLSFNYGWGVVRMPNRIMLPQYWHTEKYAPRELSYSNILPHLPLNTGDLESAHSAVRHYRDWLAHPSYDEYWKSISDEERFAQVKVPAHTHGGWFDIFLAGTINGFTGLKQQGGSPEARQESKMTIGPWGHGPSRKYGDLDFGPEADRKMFDREIQWFDHYLKGVDNGIEREPPVEIFFMGANKWARFENWPIPGARNIPYYLGSGNKLQTEAPKASTNTYRYDPADPAPTLGGNNCCGTPTVAGPKDQRPLQNRPDVLTYTSDPVQAPLAVAGPIKVKLFASTDGPDTDWMVKLIDVYPDGAAYNIAEGMLRARYRQGVDRPELLQPSKTYEFDIEMPGTANVFLPGHRIQLLITSSNFPQFDRNPNSGEPLGSATKLRVARQTIHMGGAQQSHVLLPVVNVP